MKVIAETRHAH